MKKKKVLWLGDGVPYTGFGVVNTNIISNLPKDKYEVHHLGINYRGDPHDFDWKIYPAMLGGDIWGFGRLPEFALKKFDLIFILNDAWVVAKYLEEIKKKFETVPPIVVYFPVDSTDFDKNWFKDYDIVSKAVVYTKFGYDVVKKCLPILDLEIIHHGVDSKQFYKIDLPKEEIKRKVYPDEAEFIDSFVVLNAGRNQPRKRLDISLEAFKLFSEDKPENVKYYHHAGLRDAGYDVVKLVNRLEIADRFVVTNAAVGLQQVSTEKLNLIYNATEVGLNTGTGEGWGLPSHEHAATGAPQVVPDHSACHELFEDCGLLVPISYWTRNADVLTISGLVRADDVAQKLNDLYYDQGLYESLSVKSLLKFTAEEYSWQYATKKWDAIFDKL